MKKFNNIVLSSREDAEKVWESLKEIFNNFYPVHVSDVYDLVGLPTVWEDNQWGWDSWDSIHGIEICEVEQGFEIRFPEPKYFPQEAKQAQQSSMYIRVVNLSKGWLVDLVDINDAKQWIPIGAFSTKDGAMNFAVNLQNMEIREASVR